MPTKADLEKTIIPDQILDCIGLYCPVPVFNAMEEMNKLDVGQILEMLTDDPAALEDIPRWAKRTGHLILKVQKEGNKIHFFIKKQEIKI